MSVPESRSRSSNSEEANRMLSLLPETFTFAQARSQGLSKHVVYQLRDEGLIKVLGRGLYRRVGAEPVDLGLLVIATRAPKATLCLSTALVRHGLSDAIPAAPDVALPRGTRAPAVEMSVEWHRFEPAYFDVGRERIPVDSTTDIGLYGPERSIIDAFRTRGTEGPELGYVALRRWLRQPASHPQQLVTMASNWPRVLPSLRHALEVLL